MRSTFGANRRFLVWILALLASGEAGCHLLLPLSEPEQSPDGTVDEDRGLPDQQTADHAAVCNTALSSYSTHRTSTGCNGATTCPLWDGLCLDPLNQYVVTRHNEETGDMETYGLCNVGQGRLRCMSGAGSVLDVDNAGVDTVSGTDFTGRWTLLHRTMTDYPSETAQGCDASTCNLFADTVLDAFADVRFHLRREVDGLTQWYSLCSTGTEADTKVECAALDIAANKHQNIALRRSGLEQARETYNLTGRWTLFRVKQVVVKGKTSGCSPTSNTCELWNDFEVTTDSPYSVVQFDSMTHHWFQLCAGKQVGIGSPKLLCYHRYPSAEPNPYLTVDAAGAEINMGSLPLNAEWHLLREP